MGDNPGYELDSNEKKTGNAKFDDEHESADSGKGGKSSKLKIVCGILAVAIIAATLVVVLVLVLRNDEIVGEYVIGHDLGCAITW